MSGKATSSYARMFELAFLATIALAATWVRPRTGQTQDAPVPSADSLPIAPDSAEFEDRPTRYDVQLSEVEFAKLNARYAHEPAASEVVAAALRAQERDPQRFADMTSRARLRALLPNLDVGARRGQGVDLRSTTTDELGVHLTTADDLMLFATLRFELGRLLFAGEEVAIAREERFERQQRNELVRKVVHLYFLRRRLLLERDLRSDLSLQRTLQIEEIEALLDVFTDGSWKRMMRRPTTVAPPHEKAP